MMLQNLRRTLLFFFLFTCSAFVMAQTASIRGFVYEKESGEPLLFTNVFLKGTTYGSATDVNGYFSITKIPPGDYQLSVQALGYDSLAVPVSLKADEILTKKLFVVKSGINIKTIDISAESAEKKSDVKMSVTKVTPREIKVIPSVGGEPDLAQFIQVLPGVVFTGDQGGQLYIRGGTPIQNKVLLDGMIIYNPFHSIGLFSVFDTDIIRNADVYTGGFNAEYGGRISSVMDISTRDGNKKRYSGKVAVNPFSSKVLVEGPIFKAKREDGGSASFILSGKASYLRQTSKSLYNYVDSNGLPYNFGDIYAKVVFNNPNGSKINLFGFNFQDNVRYTDIAEYNWNTTGFGTSFVMVPGSSAVLIDGNFAYSQYKITLDEADSKPRSSLINGFNLGLGFDYFFGRDELKYGLEVNGFKTNFEFFNLANRRITQEENTTELGAYARFKKVWERVVLEPSFRVQYYASLAELSPEPRLGIKVNAAKFLRFKAAGGYYSQNLLSTASDRDVVNLFYGFLSGPDDLQREFDGEKVTSRLQKARHLILGVEFDLPRHIDVNIEVYYKKFDQLTNINRDKLYEDNAANNSKPDYLKKNYIVESGDAKGLDILVKYDYKRVYLWVAYSLANVLRNDGIRSYQPTFDRRHNLNMVGSYTFGKSLLWEFSTRFNFGSGFPFTQTGGFYEYLTFEGGLNTNIQNANGDLGLIYGELNGGRLPNYFRLDLTLKRTFVLGKNSNLEINASAINALNRKNIFYINRITNNRVDQLPVIPSLGLSLTF